MRDFFFKKSMTKLPVSLLLAAAIAALAACSEGTPVTDPTAPPPPTTPADISLGTSANFILTDNATTATLTATLVDSSGAVMPGVAVSFSLPSPTSGNLNASTATTDASGQAVVTLKSGNADFSNRTATVTASVAGVASASVPIQIRGSTVALALSSNTIQVGAGTLSATATATSASATGSGLAGLTIHFSIDPSSTGAATLSAATLTTGATGVTPAVTLTPTAPGTIVLNAEWWADEAVAPPAGALAAPQAQQIITVEAASGLAFAITTPAANPFAMAASTSLVPKTQPLAATIPATIAGVAVANVRISATSGTWLGASLNPIQVPSVTGPATSILQTPTAGAVAATYTAPLNSGLVTIQVDALDAAGLTLSSLSRTFVISAPATAAAKLFLSASESTIVPSSGSNASTLTLEAVVRDSSNNTVGGAAVMFGLLGTTGSGESVSPAVVLTDSNGKATTTFSAGSAPTLGDIHAQASIVGEVCDITSLNLPPATESNNKCDTTPLKVSSSAVSVTVGFGTTVEDTANATQYKLPGSVLVVNSNGSPVAGATVTLTAFPAQYRNGRIYIGQVRLTGGSWDKFCAGPADFDRLELDTTTGTTSYRETTFVDAEDINRNGILDAGEDTQGDGVLTATSEDTNGDKILDTVPNEDSNGNGLLDFAEIDSNGNGTVDPGEDNPSSPGALGALAVTNNGLLSPPQAAGGTIPLTVTTDSNGAQTFFLQYPKTSAWFINVEVIARVIVMGTESTARTSLVLPMSVIDAEADNCPLARIADY